MSRSLKETKRRTLIFIMILIIILLFLLFLVFELKFRFNDNGNRGGSEIVEPEVPKPPVEDQNDPTPKPPVEKPEDLEDGVIGGNNESDNNKNDNDIDSEVPEPDREEKVEALFTMINSNNVEYMLKVEELVKDIPQDREYIEIKSKTEKATVALKSEEDTTICKYNVTYKTKENTFVNNYFKDNSLGELKNQLLLVLEGYKTENGITTSETYEIDLVEIANTDYIIKDVYISDKDDTASAMTHDWNITVVFRNYRDYNQNINAGKKALGELQFKLTECSRIFN